ncbi:MAG: GNAT family N-acetyltransferase [Chitinophagaceae bacterium]
MEIVVYSSAYNQQVIDLILDIQQNEFGVPVTIEDQPDLLDIENFYCKDKGNFWIITDNGKLIGTIALIDIGNRQSALRKMFVHKDYRGRDKGIGQQLLDHVIAWCKQKSIDEIYLGTFDRLQAAQKFYLRNGFVMVEKESLPQTFPLMRVDNRFFKLIVD